MGNSALMLASQFGLVKSVELLLQWGGAALLSQTDSQGRGFRLLDP